MAAGVLLLSFASPSPVARRRSRGSRPCTSRRRRLDDPTLFGGCAPLSCAIPVHVFWGGGAVDTEGYLCGMESITFDSFRSLTEVSVPNIFLHLLVGRCTERMNMIFNGVPLYPLPPWHRHHCALPRPLRCHHLRRWVDNTPPPPTAHSKRPPTLGASATPPTPTESLLTKPCTHVAPVQHVYLPPDRATGGHPGYAFGELDTAADAASAAEVLDLACASAAARSACRQRAAAAAAATATAAAAAAAAAAAGATALSAAAVPAAPPGGRARCGATLSGRRLCV